MLPVRLNIWFRWTFLILIALGVASCGSGSGEDPVIDTTDNALREFVLIWSDEFNEGSAPSIENWNVETGYGENGWGNDESQLYTNSQDNLKIIQDPADPANGLLSITARCDSGICGVRDDSITSARINTKDKFEIKYGKIEARIKTPTGKSTWPAFWMLGSNFPETPWPRVGEIDIMEIHQFFSDNKTTHFTLHWYDEELSPTPGWKFFSQFKTFDQPLTGEFHIFTAEWDEKQITGKIDGITYFTKTIDPDTMEEFFNSFFLILNVAVDGNLGGPPEEIITTPQEMLVDWVRVYEKPKPSSVGLVTDSSGIETLTYSRIINSVEFGGNSVISDLTSTAVMPVEGQNVLEIDYTSANASFSGAAFEFNAVDLSGYDSIVFSIDTSEFMNFDDISLEIVDIRNNGGSLGKIAVSLSNYSPSVSGTWARYQISLNDFVGINLDDITRIGFWNPVDISDNLIAGTLYIDDLRFDAVICMPNASVEFDSVNYNPSAAAAQISVSDQCAANSHATIKVETDTDVIVVGMDLDAAGDGVAFVNLVSPISICPTDDQTSTIALSGPLQATYSNSYIDSNNNQQSYMATATAGIDSSAPVNSIVGDRLYIYATDTMQNPLNFTPDTDFFFSDFGSGSQFDGNVTTDTTFSPVFSVSDLAGQQAILALFGFTDGFTSDAQSINFKVKNLPGNNMEVKLGQDGGPEHAFSFNLTTYSDAISLGDGWYGVTIPMSNFQNVDLYDYIVFASDASSSVNFSYLITDIFLEKSIGAPARCAAPSVSAVAPTEDPTSVISLFSNTYIDMAAADTWSAVFDTASFADVQLDSNDIKRYGNLGFAAIETITASIDASAMTNFRMDVWTPDVTNLLVKWVDFGGDGFLGVNADTEGSVTLPITRKEWVNLDIPLSDLTSAGLTSNLNDLSQLIFESIGVNGTLYIDNIYFYGEGTGGGSTSTPTLAAPTPTAAPGDVISLFSDAYTDISGIDYNPNWGQATVVTTESIAGNATLKYAGLNFQGTDFSGNAQNVTGMDTLHLDFWTPDATAVNIYLISPGPVETAFALPISTGNWVSVDIPLSSFAGVDLTNVIQLKFDDNAIGESATIYLDNLYFF